VAKRTKLDTRLFINTLLLILIFFLLLNTYLTVELKKKLAERELVQPESRAPPLVYVDYLIDQECTDCYDVTLHKLILFRLGLRLGDERFIDISSEQGQAFIERYAITLVPTVVLSQEAQQYDLFEQVWPDVGTKEDDGSYVFRAVDSLINMTYRDLDQNKIIRPQ